MSFSKRGTMLLIKTRMHACEFKRFIDFVLIDKRVPNPDSHRQWRTRPEGAAAPPRLETFRASASCSNILNGKSIFNTVKNTGQTLFFRASASCPNSEWRKIYI